MTLRARLTVLCVVAAAVLAAVVALAGFRQTIEAVREAGVSAFAATGAILALFLLAFAGVWAVLGRVAAGRIRFRILLEALTVGMATGLITPSPYLGSEPGKVLYLGHKTGLPFDRIVGAAILAKYVEGLSLALVLGGSLIAVVVSRLGLPPGSSASTATLATLLISGAALCFLVVGWTVVARRGAPLTSVVKAAARLGLFTRFLGGLGERLNGIEQEVGRVLREEVRVVLAALCLGLATQALNWIKPAVFFLVGWRLGLGAGDLSLLFLASQLALALQLAPSGIGTLDGGLLAIVEWGDIGVTAPQCAAYLLCLRFWDVAVTIAGAMLAAHAGAGLFNPSRPRG